MMKYIKIKVYLTSFTVFSGDIKKKNNKKNLYKKIKKSSENDSRKSTNRKNLALAICKINNSHSQIRSDNSP